MAVIQFKPSESLLASAKANSARKSAAWLIFGDAHLCRKAYRQLRSELVPTDLAHTNIDVMDGVGDRMADIIERISTYSLLSGPKMVAVFDLQLTGAKLDSRRLMQQIRSAYEVDDIEKAGAAYAKLMGALRLDGDDIGEEKLGVVKKLAVDQGVDPHWINDVGAYCQSNDLQMSTTTGDASLLLAAVERGFPEHHYLVLITDTIDKRQIFYKRIESIGTVIDCSVPKGDRRADRIIKENVLTETVNRMLTDQEKTMGKNALACLIEKTGFDLGTVSHNVDKLIAYVGARQRIRTEDVERLLERTKSDPVYAFTNALADRHWSEALFFMNTLMTEGPKPLRPEQILMAMLNQVRRLLLAKAFLVEATPADWHTGCTFSQFKSSVLPAIQAYDRQLIDQLAQWDPVRQPDAAEGGKKAKKRSKSPTDCILLPKPGSAYPIYLLLKKAENFSMKRLYAAYDILQQTDGIIKSGSENKTQALERAVIAICKPA